MNSTWFATLYVWTGVTTGKVAVGNEIRAEMNTNFTIQIV